MTFISECSIHFLHVLLQSEPYEVNIDQPSEFPGGPEYKIRSSYDLVGAVQRQGEFFYNISLPHYEDPTFIQNAIDRYKVSNVD